MGVKSWTMRKSIIIQVTHQLSRNDVKLVPATRGKRPFTAESRRHIHETLDGYIQEMQSIHPNRYEYYMGLSDLGLERLITDIGKHAVGES